MNPENDLLTLYDQWRVLTEGERDAIHAADWDRLRALQAEKQQLQQQILQVGATSAAAPAAAPLSPQLRSLGDHLILLERENAAALAEQRRQLELEQQALDQSSRNLQQVHRAYAQGREPAWQSYS